MALSKKHRRRLVREGRLFLWNLVENDDGPGNVLHVGSEDGCFFALYLLGQIEEPHVICITGSEFAGAATVRGRYTRFHCPCFDPHGVLTPGRVRKLIDWCLSSDGSREPLKYGMYRPYPSGSLPDAEGYLASVREEGGRRDGKGA